MGRDASRIAEEVVQHLTSFVGATVEIAIDIQAAVPDGATQNAVHDVTENARTLKFHAYGFDDA